MKVKIKKVHEDAKIPTYGTVGAACFDLYAAAIKDVADGSVTYDTGLQFEIPQGAVMMIYSRSGHGFNKGISLANRVGVIDSDYRGNVMVKLESAKTHTSGFPAVGERIAQAMIIPVQRNEFELVDELSDTKRGNGGFGSTGA
nr:MAG TPA: dUTPase [Caudoviricetes sp.]